MNKRQRYLELKQLYYVLIGGDKKMHHESIDVEEWVVENAPTVKGGLNETMKRVKFTNIYKSFQKVPEFSRNEWFIYRVHGDMNNQSCLIYSVLTILSPTYRKLDADIQYTLGLKFRLEELLPVSRATERVRNVDQNLVDSDIYDICLLTGTNALIINPLGKDDIHSLATMIIPNDDETNPFIYILNSKSTGPNAHFEPLVSSSNILFKYSEAQDLLSSIITSFSERKRISGKERKKDNRKKRDDSETEFEIKKKYIIKYIEEELGLNIKGRSEINILAKLYEYGGDVELVINSLINDLI